MVIDKLVDLIFGQRDAVSGNDVGPGNFSALVVGHPDDGDVLNFRN